MRSRISAAENDAILFPLGQCGLVGEAEFGRGKGHDHRIGVIESKVADQVGNGQFGRGVGARVIGHLCHAIAHALQGCGRRQKRSTGENGKVHVPVGFLGHALGELDIGAAHHRMAFGKEVVGVLRDGSSAKATGREGQKGCLQFHIVVSSG